MTDTHRPLCVFLCHSSKDKAAVRELYKKLRVVDGWIDPWLDEEKLLPGQDWHIEIEKAVETTDVVIVLLSNQSVSQYKFRNCSAISKSDVIARRSSLAPPATSSRCSYGNDRLSSNQISKS